MPSVTLKEGETFEQLYKRFKKAVDKDQVIKEIRDRMYYEKPSVIRKRKRAAARKRWLKYLEQERLLLEKKYRQ